MVKMVSFVMCILSQLKGGGTQNLCAPDFTPPEPHSTSKPRPTQCALADPTSSAPFQILRSSLDPTSDA